jgi:hypothetical protein
MCVIGSLPSGNLLRTRYSEDGVNLGPPLTASRFAGHFAVVMHDSSTDTVNGHAGQGSHSSATKVQLAPYLDLARSPQPWILCHLNFGSDPWL